MDPIKVLNGNYHDCRSHNIVVVSGRKSENKIYAVSAEVFTPGEQFGCVVFRDDFITKEAAEAKVAELKAGGAPLDGELKVYCMECARTCLDAYLKCEGAKRNV